MHITINGSFEDQGKEKKKIFPVSVRNTDIVCLFYKQLSLTVTNLNISVPDVIDILVCKECH